MRGSSSSSSSLAASAARNHNNSTRKYGFTELAENHDASDDIEVPSTIPRTPNNNFKKKKQKDTADAVVVSPATTFDSSLGTSPTRTFDSSTYDNDTEAPTSSTYRGGCGGGGSPTTHHTISFDHNVKTTTNTTRGGNNHRSMVGGAGLLFGLSKPMLLCGLLVLLLSTSGAAAYFFRSWLTIPGLNKQISKLETQVKELNQEIDRLSNQVDRLEVENNRYEVLNGQLNDTVIELEIVSNELNVTSNELRIVSEQLNWTNQELNQNIEDLEQENLQYQSLNQELNSTTIALHSEIELFKIALSNMIQENEALNDLTISLQDLTTSLSNITTIQNETLVELEQTLNEFTTENNRLSDINQDLKILISFLNETSSGLGNNLDQITEYLADQIMINQQLVVEQIENTYRQRISTWDCDYRDIFRDENFGTSESESISISDFNTKILPYLDGRVLSELCLNTIDFSNYIQSIYSFDGTTTRDPLTTNRLIRSVLLYTGTALDYYFPSNEIDVGISTEEWSNASYKCQNLDNPFRYDN